MCTDTNADRGVLALAVAGKGSFGGVLAGMNLLGELPPVAAAVGLPDLALAAVFAGWLSRVEPALCACQILPFR